jgi:hypothetical protein
VSGVVYGPAYDLQIFFSRGGEEPGGNQVAANRELAGADFESAFEGLFDLAVVEQRGHERGLDFANGGENAGVEGDDHGACNLAGFAQVADEGMFPAPGARGLQLEIKNDVVFFCEVENFVESGKTFAGKLAAEPRAGIEAANFGEGHVVDRAFAVGGTIHGLIVDSYEAGVAGQLQIGLDKSGAERDGFLEGRQSIFGRVTGSAAVSDQQHGGLPDGESAANATLRRAAGFLSERESSDHTVRIVTFVVDRTACTHLYRHVNLTAEGQAREA